jgi:two-component system nitrogen regulation sensor histidine kinase NtrY
VFDQCTATIVRQVDDIKRMVDEFSSFARMPKPPWARTISSRPSASHLPDADGEP